MKRIIRIIGGGAVISLILLFIGLIWGEWVFWLKIMGTDAIIIALTALIDNRLKP